MTTTGEPLNHAVVTALTPLVTPGPAVTTASPGARVSRAVASAANTAVCSCRTSTRCIGGSALTAPSYSGNTCPPDRVNIVLTPCRRAAATACAPPCRAGSCFSSAMPARYQPLPGRSERAGQRLDRHLELAQHVQVVLGGTAKGGEVVADDDRVDPAQYSGLRPQVAQGQLAPAGIAQHGARQGQPERGDRAQRVAG